MSSHSRSAFILLVFIVATNAEPPTPQSSGLGGWFSKRQTMSPPAQPPNAPETPVTTDQMKLMNMINAQTSSPPPQNNPGGPLPQGFPVPTKPLGANDLLVPGETPPQGSHFDYITKKIPQVVTNGVEQVKGAAVKGSNAVMNIVKPKKTKDDLKKELVDLDTQLDSAYQMTKALLLVVDNMPEDELDRHIQGIKDGLRPTVAKPNQIVSQVKKAQQGVQDVVKDPSTIQDNPLYQTVANHEITQKVITHPISKRTFDLVGLVIGRFFGKEPPNEVQSD